jgi:hypothetical protein
MTQQPEPIIIADTDDIAKIKAELKRTDEPKKWQYFLSIGPQLAAAFANSTPPQGAGEIVFSVRDDGMVDMFAFF